MVFVTTGGSACVASTLRPLAAVERLLVCPRRRDKQNAQLLGVGSGVRLFVLGSVLFANSRSLLVVVKNRDGKFTLEKMFVHVWQTYVAQVLRPTENKPYFLQGDPVGPSDALVRGSQKRTLLRGPELPAAS